jgi:hypothetical protein
MARQRRQGEHGLYAASDENAWVPDTGTEASLHLTEANNKAHGPAATKDLLYMSATRAKNMRRYNEQETLRQTGLTHRGGVMRSLSTARAAWAGRVASPAVAPSASTSPGNI